MPHELEAWIGQKVRDVFFRAGKEIVDAKNVMPAIEETFTQVRSEESCSARNEHSCSRVVVSQEMLALSWSHQ